MKIFNLFNLMALLLSLCYPLKYAIASGTGFIPLLNQEGVEHYYNKRSKTLKISEPLFDDLSIIKDLYITELVISNTLVRDLSPISNMVLESLDISRTAVSDIEVLDCSGMKWFVANGTKITNIAVLSNAYLTYLRLDDTGIDDLSALVSSTNTLEWLSIRNTSISNINILSGMPLHQLDITGTKVTDVTPLMSLPLESLCFSEEIVTNAEILKTHPVLNRKRKGMMYPPTFINQQWVRRYWKGYDKRHGIAQDSKWNWILMLIALLVCSTVYFLLSCKKLRSHLWKGRTV